MAVGRVPGPGARTFCAKTMRRLPLHGRGGQLKCGMQSAECEMAKRKVNNSEFRICQGPIGPPHPAEAGRSLQEEGQPGRCFLPRSSLPPGHNSSIPEMSNAGSFPAEPGVYPNEIRRIARDRRSAQYLIDQLLRQWYFFMR